MKFLASLLALAVALPSASALPLEQRDITTSWAGVNSYFLHAYQKSDRIAVLDAIKAAKLKTVRIFISHTYANNKDTNSVEMPDIEPDEVGEWDDTQLRAIDQLMVEAKDRGIKLIIALHDRYMLGCWGSDAYVSKYKLPAVDCGTPGAIKDNDVTWWYQDPSPIYDFENRIAHILNHQNSLLGGKAWKDLSDYIFSFNIQNEGQGHLRNNVAPAPNWWCDRSKKMRSIMGSSKILVSTGGGNEFSNSDISQNWACNTLDVVDIHSYNGVDGFKQNAPTSLNRAKSAGKLVLFEEFGAIGDSKSSQVQQHIDVFNGLKAPWMIWQINKPGKGSADFEFWTDEATYGVVKTGAEKALTLTAAQSFRNL
ncbi:glycoside hydrolase [Pseudovirgaria hyperparasitica]|uniref:mannan endo-1,4-beta-mannosidase n=1 Tax=Pseudovirgaria hyperparasitica TaxID=470096 RepID=A0A6A6W6R2_9PEZI|nr:glycoside hydrolase [Pseudovirgaria hyperparasitica]KAF2757650.1 glycoside hydrolase [Pseudovirgaria hyperparasitica]